MSVTVQKYNSSPSMPTAKVIYPSMEVKMNSTVLLDYNRVSISTSRDNASDSFSVDFLGEENYSSLSPETSPAVPFTVTTGNTISGSGVTKIQVVGYPDDLSQSFNINKLQTKVNFLEKIVNLLPPKAQKMIIDVRLYNSQAREQWSVGDDLSGKFGSTSCSEIINFVLTESGTGIGLRYLGYDYRIIDYRIEDYPLNIIQNLIKFVGCYINFNSVNNVIEIRDKFPTYSSCYDFLYTDTGDIADLGCGESALDFHNAVIVSGTVKDDSPELGKEEEIGYGVKDDDDLYLVDSVQGKEPAPSDPYIDDPPTDLIEKKFFNVFLGFDIDPGSIQVKGGSWNSETQKYEGAQLIGYGGMLSSSQVLLSDVNQAAIPSTTSKTPLPPGEGMVGTPWNYEENTNIKGEFGLSDGIYTVVDLMGKVVSALTVETNYRHPIAGAQVEIDFAYENNIWQYWRRKSIVNGRQVINAVVRFYLPVGTVALGNDWEDVTSDYPELPDPVGFPKSTLTGTGEDTDEEGGKGVFTFAAVPISEYTATGSAAGYDEGDLDITFNTEDIWEFLKSPGADENKKKRLVDTPYSIAIYAKKAPPIIFGDYDPEEAGVTEPEVVSVDLRHTRGIALANDKLLYASEITDPRVISDEIAIKAGLAVILESLSKRKTKRLRLPHNPWLKKGDRIAVQSYAKGWTGSNKKLLIVDQIQKEYVVGDSGQESFYDVVTGVQQF